MPHTPVISMMRIALSASVCGCRPGTGSRCGQSVAVIVCINELHLWPPPSRGCPVNASQRQKAWVAVATTIERFLNSSICGCAFRCCSAAKWLRLSADNTLFVCRSFAHFTLPRWVSSRQSHILTHGDRPQDTLRRVHYGEYARICWVVNGNCTLSALVRSSTGRWMMKGCCTPEPHSNEIASFGSIRHNFNVLNTIYKMQHNLQPKHLCKNLKYIHQQHTLNTRSRNDKVDDKDTK